MKTLTLSIKQKYFDEIVAGTKTHEYREIRPNIAHRYIEYHGNDGKIYAANKNKEIPEDVEIDAVPIKYDAIKLLTGAYTGKRPYIIVEVLDAEIVYLVDENDEEIVYEYEGVEYVMAEMDYTLGKIIERSEY